METDFGMKQRKEKDSDSNFSNFVLVLLRLNFESRSFCALKKLREVYLQIPVRYSILNFL